MTTIKEIAWVAGLLEGEGYFGTDQKGVPRIKLSMTDLDVVGKFKTITKSTSKILTEPPSGNKKELYTLILYNNHAAQWMMTIIGLVGKRRREKIITILSIWKNRSNGSNHHSDVNYSRRNLIMNYIRLGFTEEQAASTVNSLLVSNSLGVNR